MSSSSDDKALYNASPDDNVIFQRLQEGFAALREHQYGPSDAAVQLESTHELLQHAIVNFVDPTASNVQFSPAKPTSSGSTPQQPKTSLELYEKLTLVLQAEYNATLRKVPYTSFRNGATGVIDSLKIKTYMTGSQGGLMLDTSDVPWADTGSVTGQGADPSEWHKGPFCHVYLAACDTLEHYRTKVKPSIQAFLSQIDAVAKHPVGNKDTSEVGGSQYVIVFVPSGDNKFPDEAQKGPGGKLGIWASARQRMAQQQAEKADREASGGSAVNTSTDNVDVEDIAPGQQTLMTYLSRYDREIMRRMSLDFSAGIVCQLSTLMDAAEEDVDGELKKLEWNAFLKGLGTAIVNGFRERCRKYDEELRKLDQMRGGAVTPASPVLDRFDYSTFFLVKEGLAFTYQQMSMHAEASLQYDELQAVLPELKPIAKPKAGGALFAFSGSGVSPSSSLSQGFLTGDIMAFRMRIRSVKDLQPLAHTVHQYIFTRQTELSFRTAKPVEVVERCLTFIRAIYNYRKLLLEGSTDLNRLKEVEMWAYNFCWDVKRACESFHADETESMSLLEVDGYKMPNQRDSTLARCLCDVLEFTRSRFVQLGDLSLPKNPIRSQSNILDQAMTEVWTVWNPLMAKSAAENDEDESESSAAEELNGNLLLDSLASEDAYLTGYLGLLKVIEVTNRSAGRHRCSARIAIEMAGIYVHRKDLQRATLALRAASEVYAVDHWEITRFLILLRMATYQRKISTADDYINTLVQCFSPAMKKSAPPKALEVLHHDLEAVLRSSLVSRPRFQAFPIFDPILGLDGMKPKSRGLSNRDLLKKLYTVGDKATVTVALVSYLAKDIEIQEISVDLVPFRAYVATIEESRSHGNALDFDEDRFRVLRLAGPLKISPGENEFSLDWNPMVPGQFVLASVSVKWHGIRFVYIARELKRATVRVDILPAEPTQTLSVSPESIVPGHTQPITILFNPCKDVIKNGTVKLECSSGLLLLPPNELEESDKWAKDLETPLSSCSPGETFKFNVLAKTVDGEEVETVSETRSVHVTVSTVYHPPLPEQSTAMECGDASSNVSLEKHTMEARIETLSRRSLTVEDVGLVFYTRDQATATVTLQCNSAAPLTINSWSLSLPSFVKLSDNGDYNALLKHSLIEPNEEVTLVFDCTLVSESTDSVAQLVIYIDDEQGNSYNESFSLRMTRPTAALSTPDIKPIPVTILPSASHGLAVEPIGISYRVDITNLGVSSNYRYRILVDPTVWIVCGKCEGLVIETEPGVFETRVVALPARPGTIKAYPELSLFYLDRETGKESLPLPITVSTANKEFKSQSALKHTTVAVPVLKG